MSLLELLGESHDPGPTGSVEWKGPDGSGDDPATIALRAAITIAACALVLWWAYDAADPWFSLGRAAGILAVYLLVSGIVSPQPDDTNLGWFGGVIDNPFRWSDDYNRWLVFLLIVVTPGRLAGAALLDVVRLVRSRRRSGLPPGKR